MDKNQILIEIYAEDDSKTKNLLYKTRGYRRDIYVKLQDKFYKMNVFSFTYLKQFLQNQYKLNKIYNIGANLLIVKTLSKNEIVATILKEAQNHYFEELKECQLKDGEIIYALDIETKITYQKENLPQSFPISKLKRIY